MNAENNQIGHDNSRRKFIKKMAYIPPVVMSLSTVPSYATTGSPRQYKDSSQVKDYKHGHNERYEKDDKHVHNERYEKDDKHGHNGRHEKDDKDRRDSKKNWNNPHAKK